jgi:hypothetical protein
LEAKFNLFSRLCYNLTNKDVEDFFKDEVLSSLFNYYIDDIISDGYNECLNRCDNKRKRRQGNQASSGVPSLANPGSLSDPDHSPSMTATDEVNSLRLSLPSRRDDYEEEKIPKMDSKQYPGIKTKAISKNKGSKGSKGPERASNPEQDLPEQSESVQERFEKICNLLIEKGKMIAEFKNKFIYLSPSEVELKKEYLAAAKNKKK